MHARAMPEDLVVVVTHRPYRSKEKRRASNQAGHIVSFVIPGIEANGGYTLAQLSEDRFKNKRFPDGLCSFLNEADAEEAVSALPDAAEDDLGSTRVGHAVMTLGEASELFDCPMTALAAE